MSETIDRMLAEARARARAPSPQWWERLTSDTIGDLHLSAIRDAGLVADPRLSDLVERTYTWRNFVQPCLRAHVNPLSLMVEHLRETGEGALIPRPVEQR